MDGEVYNKAIQAYIKDSEKDIPHLIAYAKLMRSETKVRKLIGV